MNYCWKGNKAIYTIYALGLLRPNEDYVADPNARQNLMWNKKKVDGMIAMKYCLHWLHPIGVCVVVDGGMLWHAL